MRIDDWRATPYGRYGKLALCNKLLELPSRRQSHPPFELQAPTKERIELECQIVDDWAIDLFRYCCRRPQPGLRMYAMVANAARDFNPADVYMRLGLYPTYEACARIRAWVDWAQALPP